MTTDSSDAVRIIGRNISRLLQESGMTQADLAEKIGLSESAVGKWVLGKGSPRMGNVQKMADLFRVPISTIIEENTPREIAKSREQAFLFDRISKASLDDLRKLSQLLDIIEQEDKNR